MECVKLDIKNRTVKKKVVDIPKIEDPDEVIVRVLYSGICGTDLHIVHGQFDAVDGVTLGHEFIGFIYDAPSECKMFAKGDRVAVNPNRACGMCLQCRRNAPNLCIDTTSQPPLGIGKDGGWAEYCRVHISLLYKIPDNLTYEQGNFFLERKKYSSLLEDLQNNETIVVLAEPISCIIHGLDKIGNIEIGSTILVIGAGIIGILWSCILHLIGHRRVYISEPEECRRQLVDELGLGYKCKSWEDIVQSLSADSVDLCIDCSGNINAIQAAIPLLRRGGILSIFGVSAPDKLITLAPFKIYKKELTIVGNVINTPQSFEKAVAFMESMGNRYLDMEKLNIKTFPLDDFQGAFDAFNSRKYSKIIFKV